MTETVVYVNQASAASTANVSGAWRTCTQALDALKKFFFWIDTAGGGPGEPRQGAQPDGRVSPSDLAWVRDHGANIPGSAGDLVNLRNMAGVTIAAEARRGTEAGTLFDILDTNNDGLITPESITYLQSRTDCRVLY